MRLIKPHSQGGFIRSNRQKRRPCADAANEFITRLISRIIPYLAFCFFHFSMTPFLQLAVYIEKGCYPFL